MLHPHSHVQLLAPVQLVRVVLDEVRQGQQQGGVSQQGQIEEDPRAAGPTPQVVDEDLQVELDEELPKDQHRQEEGYQ